ncbi:MAG: gamma-glutamylcyclotransferase family protein [Aliidongia sp.]
MSDASEYLFSYGTLQLEAVQLATFGRLLDGRKDRLPAYGLTQLAIADPQVVATSGKTHHPIISLTGREQDVVDGMVLSVTPAELAQADAYEVGEYRRERVTLASGLAAWAYVAAAQLS